MDGEPEDDGVLAPGAAFAALGHEIRVGIVEALAEATRVERPLSFSTIRDRVGTVDSAKFNYHLDELVGHFVVRRGNGYDLSPAGRRVAEAVLSGAVTGDATIDRVPVDASCPFCGAGIELAYRPSRVETFCPECAGTYDMDSGVTEKDAPEDYGFLGYRSLPPAGTRGRDPEAVHDAASRWHAAQQMLAATGTCPRCSAPMEAWLTLCEDHADEGACEHCENRYAALHSARCTNCVYARRAAFGAALLDDPALQSFLVDHGVNLAAPGATFTSVLMDYAEDVRSVDPFEAAFTFTAAGDALTLTVDDDLSVMAATEHAAD